MAAPFVDTAKITVRSGNGGNGVVSFHREKYVAAGGPDGGDGGRGGNVVVEINDHMSTLMDFRYKRKYVAANGMDGQGKRCTGKDGEDLILRVPRGTVIRDAETREIIKDMSDDAPFILCRGGRGGWGNKHFATPTRQVPRFAKAGLPGESRDVILELKLLADVGLVGFPNVGKSTLLSVVSRAQPKIANYHFTTLFPNLGVVYVEEGVSFVMADIPGIIEGAAEGAGLGHDFLRHIDRCRLLIHVVDVSGSEGRDPVEDFETINTELREYSPEHGHPGDGVAHLTGGVVGEVAHRIQGLLGGAGGDQHMAALQVVGQSQAAENVVHQLLGLRHPPGAHRSAGQVAGAGGDDLPAVAAQNVQVVLGHLVFVHVGVHGRGNEFGAGAG